MFGNDSRIEIAVLQERFKAHEQIMEKVDTAIQTLSATNQNICKMLAKNFAVKLSRTPQGICIIKL